MQYKVIFFAFAFVLAACSSADPKRVEKDFGVSVRQMIEAQIHRSEDIKSPSNAGPGRLDGESAVRAVEQYENAAKKVKRSGGSSGFKAQ